MAGIVALIEGDSQAGGLRDCQDWGLIYGEGCSSRLRFVGLLPARRTAMLKQESFDAVLQLLSRMAGEHSGECFILFSSPWSGTIELADPSVLGVLGDAGMDDREIRRAFAEVSGLLMAVLRDDFEGFLQLGTPFEEEADSEARRGEYQRRFDAVHHLLVDDHLRRRNQLKRLSKAPAFSDLDWDIKLKLADASESSFVPFPYATIRLKYDTSFEDGASPFPLLTTRQTQSVQVNFTVDEIDYVIAALRRARESLDQAEHER